MKETLKGLKLLEYRGYDSAGIASIENNKLIHFKCSGKLENLEKKINFKNLNLKIAIGHTRWATHGVASNENAHPHFDSENSLALVHNGIIENFDEIKNFLINKKKIFLSETDSEVLAHLIAYNYKKDIIKALKSSLDIIKGSYAIAFIHKDFPKRIILASKDSPMAIGFTENKKEIIISSDPNSFVGRNLHVLFLQNDELGFIENNEIFIFNKNLKKIAKQAEKVNCKNISFSKNNFEHYMLKEIYEQPFTIQKTILGRISKNSQNCYFEEHTIDIDFLNRFKNIKLIACGTSYHASLLASYLFEDISKIETRAYIGSEMRFQNILNIKESLIIAISQSGETADTILPVKELKKNGATVLSIINKSNSTLSRESDYSLYLKAGPEFSVCSTKAFTSQISLLLLLAIHFEKLKNNNKSNSDYLIKNLLKVPNEIKKLLKRAEEIKKLSIKYAKYENFYFLGKNLMYVTAVEAALKLKEISYINATAYPAGEMKHGPLALVNGNLPIVAFMANDKTYDKMYSNVIEAKTRGSPILAIAKKKDKDIEKIADDVFYIDDSIDETAIFSSSVFGQLFAYYIAKERNTDIDQPRNLAKSVTVE
ncbi:MAG: hypothetical protein A3F40_00020 [Chlamydiae bacterium RIFCSPHIGHO2_12_FULL_27_8]|nr:MAG: hypothetical protein A3F40_00020 [Chlamydiae bacterium RIFCSPHIGHO2_12_FULL_27_8]